MYYFFVGKVTTAGVPAFEQSKQTNESKYGFSFTLGILAGSHAAELKKSKYGYIFAGTATFELNTVGLSDHWGNR